MSSAFRNFVLTFLLALIVFGLVAWRVLPAAEAALLGTDPAEESSDTSDTASGGELSEDPNVQPVDPEKDDGFACLFVGKNGSGRICSLIFTRVSESRERYVVVDIPASTHLSVGSGYAPLYSILNDKDVAAVTSTVSSLVGCDIDYCFVADASSLGQVAALHGNMSVTLPYAVRYLSPEFAVIPEEDRSEEHYVTIPAGSVRLNAENTPYILSAVPNGENEYTYDYSLQGTICFSIFEQLFSRRDIGDNTSLLIELAECVETNAEINAVVECAPAMFSKGSYSYANVTYTTVTRSFEGSVVRVPDVFAAIEAIRAAYTGE